MKDSELDQLLRSANVPDVPAGYWDEFPRRIMAKTHWLGNRPAAGTSPPQNKPFWFRSRFRFAAFGLGLALAALLGFVLNLRPIGKLSITNGQLASALKYFQEIETLFPGQLQAIVFDPQGPHLALAERSTVPTSAPLFLRICGPNGCQNFVTFSGQQISFNGETCEVLLGHEGHVLLVGPEWVLSTAQAPTRHARYQIAGRRLEATL